MNNIIKSALENYDSNQEKILKILKKVFYIERRTTERVKYIIFYDKDKKKLFESSYQIAGIYLVKNNIWKWAWALSARSKDETYLSRKVLDYAFNLDNEDELELRSRLINSNIQILNNIQIDINISIISYITKIPFIFKIPLINLLSKRDGNLIEYSQYFIDDNVRDNNIMMYLYLLDFTF